MNRREALEAVERSFLRGSCSPCPWASDPDASIARQQQALRDQVMYPAPVRVAREVFEHGAAQSLSSEPVWAIARSGDHWLLCAPRSEVFALAFGCDPVQLHLLGFASGDALAEWLG